MADDDTPPQAHSTILDISGRVAVMEERSKTLRRDSEDHEERIRIVEQFGPKLFAWATAGGFVASLLARVMSL